MTRTSSVIPRTIAKIAVLAGFGIQEFGALQPHVQEYNEDDAARISPRAYGQ
jgi:hypothetical protein